MLAFPVQLDPWVGNVSPIREEHMRAAFDHFGLRREVVLGKCPTRPPVLQGGLERLDIDDPRLFRHGEDLVAHRDRSGGSEERSTQAPVKCFGRLGALFLGRDHCFQRRKGRDRIFRCRTLPHLPAGPGLERSGDRDLCIEDLLGRRGVIDQLQGKGARIDGDAVFESHAGASLV
jgi:hypothetical protein